MVVNLNGPANHVVSETMLQGLNAFVVCVDDEDRLLLTRSIEVRRASWTLPGGHVMPGEHPRDTAARRFGEETGLELVIAPQPFAVTSRNVPAKRRPIPGSTHDLHIVNLLYRARADDGIMRPAMDGVTDGVEWFPLTAVPEQRIKLVKIALERAGLWRMGAA